MATTVYEREICCGDNEHGLQPKRSCPTDDDDDYESSDYFLEESVTLDHVNESGFQKEYSSLTEDASNVGEGSQTRGMSKKLAPPTRNETRGLVLQRASKNQ